MSQRFDRFTTTTGWIASGGLLLLAVYTFVGGRSFTGLLVGLAAAAICMPPVFRFIGVRMPRASLLKVVFLTALILCTAQSIFGHLGSNRRAEQRSAAVEDARVRAAAVSMVKDSNYFTAHKGEVLASIREKFTAGRLRDAREEAARYRSADSDLVALKGAIEAEQIKIDLRDESSMPLERRAERYRRLVQLEPTNRTFIVTSTELDARIATEARKVEENKKRDADAVARQASIERQFSKWDGSNIAVEEAIKGQMKNPDSYKHVETRYVEAGTGLIVSTTFRGTNGFNAVVTQTAVAAVDGAGRVVSLTIK